MPEKRKSTLRSFAFFIFALTVSLSSPNLFFCFVCPATMKRQTLNYETKSSMRHTCHRLSEGVFNSNATSTPAHATGAAAVEVVEDCLAAIRRGAAVDALPRLNDLKAHRAHVQGVDYARALCFLASGAGRNAFEARQSLLEELRLHPRHRPAQLLLNEVNELVRPFLLPPREVQREHPLFALLCDALLDFTMLSWPRLLSLYTATERLARGGSAVDPGHLVECGTAGGGAAVLMAVVLAEYEKPTARTAAVPSSSPQQRQHEVYQRRVFALDTFAGMPAPGSEDVLVQSRASAPTDVLPRDSAASWGTGTCCSPAEHVRQLAASFSVENRLVVLPGLFQSSIPTQLLTRPEVQRDAIALLHVDADWYASTRTALELLVPVMRRQDDAASPLAASHPPRMVQVDDYHYWKGCRRAVDEYLAQWSAPSAPPGVWTGPPALEDVDDNAVSFNVYRDTPAPFSR